MRNLNVEFPETVNAILKGDIKRSILHRCGAILTRYYSEGTSQNLSEGELKLSSILKDKFPKASFVQVQDISGGCGSMYEIQIEAEEFRGKRTVLQHRMVNEALKQEIKDMHGLRISTAVAESSPS